MPISKMVGSLVIGGEQVVVMGMDTGSVKIKTGRDGMLFLGKEQARKYAALLLAAADMCDVLQSPGGVASLKASAEAEKEKTADIVKQAFAKVKKCGGE